MQLAIAPDLNLQTLREADAPTMFALVDRNRAHLRRWLPWLDFNTQVGASLDFIRGQTAKARREEEIPFGIYHQQRLSGTVAYNWIDVERRACGLGYWLSEDLQGKGIATRAVQALVRHAFDVLALDTVEIHVATGNLRSRALAERLGFQHARILPRAEWLYDHHVDHAVYERRRAAPL